MLRASSICLESLAWIDAATPLLSSHIEKELDGSIPGGGGGKGCTDIGMCGLSAGGIEGGGPDGGLGPGMLPSGGCCNSPAIATYCSC